MVFSKVGASVMAAMESTSALCCRNASSYAGLKCSLLILSNGGTPCGVSYKFKNGFSFACLVVSSHDTMNAVELINRGKIRLIFMIVLYGLVQAAKIAITFLLANRRPRSYTSTQFGFGQRPLLARNHVLQRKSLRGNLLLADKYNIRDFLVVGISQLLL